MHESVLLKECIDGLEIKEGDLVVDATVNGGGASEEVLERFGGKVKLISIDADEEALKRARERLERFGEKTPVFIHGNFRNLKSHLEKIGISAIDRIMFDIGLSSNQLDVPTGGSGRGFSFRKDEPLLMTFSAHPKEDAITAFDIANSWEKENIETIIRSYGGERKAGIIAKAIVEARKEGPIKTSKQLSDIIERVVRRTGKIHPATKTFQAFRIAVNDELESLKEGIGDAFELLRPGGRMAVISFHSLEDRIVKNFMKAKSLEKTGLLITKKPIVPDREEETRNPRGRSAKLRILEKIR